MPHRKSSSLEVDTHRDGTDATVVVAGEIDLESAATLRDALAALADCTAVHLDLANVDYIDSTGLRAVLVARDQITAGGGSLDVVAASNIVSRLIEITGIEGLLAT